MDFVFCPPIYVPIGNFHNEEWTRSELNNHKKEIRIISATQENIPLTSEALWAGKGSFKDLQIKLEHKGS